jgi:hypothetical protein
MRERPIERDDFREGRSKIPPIRWDRVSSPSGLRRCYCCQQRRENPVWVAGPCRVHFLPLLDNHQAIEIVLAPSRILVGDCRSVGGSLARVRRCSSRLPSMARNMVCANRSGRRTSCSSAADHTFERSRWLRQPSVWSPIKPALGCDAFAPIDLPLGPFDGGLASFTSRRGCVGFPNMFEGQAASASIGLAAKTR